MVCDGFGCPLARRRQRNDAKGDESAQTKARFVALHRDDRQVPGPVLGAGSDRQPVWAVSAKHASEADGGTGDAPEQDDDLDGDGDGDDEDNDDGDDDNDGHNHSQVTSNSGGGVRRVQ